MIVIENLKAYFRREFSPEKLKWDQIVEDEKKGRNCPKCGRFGFYIHLPTSIREYWWGMYRCKGCKTEYRPKFTKGNMFFLLLMAFFYFNYFGKTGFSYKSYITMVVGFAFALGVNYVYAHMSKKAATTATLLMGLGWLLAIVEVILAHHGEGVATGNPKDIAYLAGSTGGFTYVGGTLIGLLPGAQRTFEELFELLLKKYDPAKQRWDVGVHEAPPPPPLIDPDTGEPLVVQDGKYEGGKPGQVWYGGQWVDRDTAIQWIRERQEEIAQREKDRPAWSLMNRPSPDHQWDETSQSWVLKGDQTPYTGDRPAWSLANRPSPDHDWDETTQSWVPKDDLRRQKMEREGYSYDPYQDAWRKPPEIEKPQIEPEQGDASRPDMKPGWISYDTSTDSLDKRLNDLEKAERDALDQYRKVHDEVNKARESGDKWLEEQWRGRLDDARKNVRDVQGLKNDLVNRVDERAQRAIDLQQKIDKGIVQHAKDVGRELWHLPGEMIDSWKNDPAFVQTMKDAIEARNRLQKDMDLAPELNRQHQETFDKIRDLRDQINEARKNGDTELERRLREQAEPLKNDLRQIADKMNQIHDHKGQWERKASMANLSAYQKSTDLVLSGTQVPETAKVVNNYIDLYRRQNIPGRHGHDLTGGDDGWTYRETVGEKSSGPRTLTKTEVDLDAEHFQKVSQGAKKVADYNAATTPEQAKKTTIDCLEDYQAKLQQKYAPPDIKKQWSYDVEQHRTKPLFEDMANEANKRGLLVKDGDSLRPVRPDDFSPVSSKKDPGMDLDIKYNEMIDPKTGKKVGFNEVQDISNQSCKNLKFDPDKQGIKVVGGPKGSKHPEAFPIKEGATADTMYRPEHLRKMDGADAEQAYRVTEYKGADARHLGPADSLSERCRGTTKDYGRVTKQLMEAHPGSKKPFSDEAMNVMKQVGDGTLPPGTGNQKFRELTGMNLEDGCRKIDSLQESVVKLDSRKGPAPISTDVPSGTGGAKPGPTQTGRDSQLSELAKPSPEEAARRAKVDQYAEQLRRGETPKFEEGHKVSDGTRANAFDSDKTKPPSLEEIQRQKGLERHEVLTQDPEYVRIEKNVQKAWSEARQERMKELIEEKKSYLVTVEKVSPDHPDLDAMAEKRAGADHIGQVRSIDKFESKMQDMINQGKMKQTDFGDYQDFLSGKRQPIIGKPDGDIPVTEPPLKGPELQRSPVGTGAMPEDHPHYAGPKVERGGVGTGAIPPEHPLYTSPKAEGGGVGTGAMPEDHPHYAGPKVERGGGGTGQPPVDYYEKEMMTPEPGGGSPEPMSGASSFSKRADDFAPTPEDLDKK